MNNSRPQSVDNGGHCNGSNNDDFSNRNATLMDNSSGVSSVDHSDPYNGSNNNDSSDKNTHLIDNSSGVSSRRNRNQPQSVDHHNGSDNSDLTDRNASLKSNSNDISNCNHPQSVDCSDHHKDSKNDDSRDKNAPPKDNFSGVSNSYNSANNSKNISDHGQNDYNSISRILNYITSFTISKDTKSEQIANVDAFTSQNRTEEVPKLAKDDSQVNLYIESLTETLEDVRTELSKSNAALDAAKKDLDATKGKLTAAEEDKRRLLATEKKPATANWELTATKRELYTAKNDLNNFKLQLSIGQRQISLLQESIAKLTSKNSLLESEMDRKVTFQEELKVRNEFLESEMVRIATNQYTLSTQLREEKDAHLRIKQQCERKDADLARMSKKMKVLEHKVLEYQQSNGELPSTNIGTGVYESGGVTPQDIQHTWREIYTALRKVCFQSLKRLGHDRWNSKAFKDCQVLVSNNLLQAAPLPIETNMALHKVSIELMHIFGVHGMANISNLLIISKMPHSHGNSTLWKKDLQMLPKPDFKTLFDPCEALQKLSKENSDYYQLWYEVRMSVIKNLEDYDISSSDISASIDQIVYACIYLKIQMQSIGDNIGAYVTGTGTDCLEFHEYDRDLQVLDILPNRDVTLYDIVFDIKISREDRTEDDWFSFTVFPGIGYLDGDSWKVISRCMVASYEFSE